MRCRCSIRGVHRSVCTPAAHRAGGAAGHGGDPRRRAAPCRRAVGATVPRGDARPRAVPGGARAGGRDGRVPRSPRGGTRHAHGDADPRRGGVRGPRALVVGTAHLPRPWAVAGQAAPRAAGGDERRRSSIARTTRPARVAVACPAVLPPADQPVAGAARPAGGRTRRPRAPVGHGRSAAPHALRPHGRHRGGAPRSVADGGATGAGVRARRGPRAARLRARDGRAGRDRG